MRFSISFRDTILDQSKKFTGNPDADINLRLIIDVERNETWSDRSIVNAVYFKGLIYDESQVQELLSAVKETYYALL